MASHNQPPSLRIIGGLDEALAHSRGELVAKTHRVMVALPVKTLDQIVRENGAEAQHREPVQFIPSPDRRPTLLERLADFFGSDRGFCFACGFYAGAMVTVAAALVIA